MQRAKGFTLIELMIVIAIVALLVAIALPAYQDYTIRAKVSEGVLAAAPAKLAITEIATARAVLPTAVTDNAYAAWVSHASTHVASIDIVNGVITVVTDNTGAAADPTLEFQPVQTSLESPITWRCVRITGENKHVPAGCRS